MALLCSDFDTVATLTQVRARFKVVCHVSLNTRFIFPRIGIPRFYLSTQYKFYSNLERLCFRLRNFSVFRYLQSTSVINDSPANKRPM